LVVPLGPIVLIVEPPRLATLLWRVTSELPNTTVFFEPVHPFLPSLVKLLHISPATVSDLRPMLAPYLELDDVSRFHRPEHGLSRLYLEKHDDHPTLAAYLRSLVESAAARSRRPVLIVRRAGLRVGWFRAQFRDASVVCCFEHPRESWKFSVARSPAGDLLDPQPAAELDTTKARDLVSKFPFLADTAVRHPYQRHYLLARLEQLSGKRLASSSIDMADLTDAAGPALTELREQLGLPSEAVVNYSQQFGRPGETDSDVDLDTEVEGLERDSEALLDDLGLTKRFGLAPLDEIIAENSRYRELCADSAPCAWAMQSAQEAVARLQFEARERERRLRELRAAEEHARVTLKELEVKSEWRLQRIHQLEAFVQSAGLEVGSRLRLVEATVARQTELLELLATASGLQLPGNDGDTFEPTVNTPPSPVGEIHDKPSDPFLADDYREAAIERLRLLQQYEADFNSIRLQMEEKEQVIAELHAAATERLSIIEQQEVALLSLRQALEQQNQLVTELEGTLHSSGTGSTTI
jgi:hypothetical protein